MATAEPRIVKKRVLVEDVDGVTLHLNQKEAETLFHVTGRIGGGGDTPRGHMDSIAIALGRAGVKRPNLITESANRAIYYRNEPDEDTEED